MKTGWPPDLLQDDCRKLFRWFADRIDARWVLRQTLKVEHMRNFSQRLIDGLDKRTEDGFAEALLIAISNLKNKDGLLISVQLGQDTAEMVDFARQIAKMMLNKEAK